MAQQTTTATCSSCFDPYVKISQEAYDKGKGDLGWVVYCSKCAYKHKILREQSDKLNGLTLRPSKFELGKFHIFYKFGKRYERGGHHAHNIHFIIDIIKITNCFITYKIKSSDWWSGEWFKCKRKIDRSDRYAHKIQYPKELNEMNRVRISINDLYRKCD